VDTINRRRFLALSGLSAAGAWMGTAHALAAQTDATALNPRNLLASPRFASTPFTLGVASGDPSADGMVLWTRLATEPLVFGGGMPTRPMVVEWQLAADDGMRKVVRQGSAMAHPELGHAVHVELDGLAPGRPYWYRFTVGGHASTVGCTRTLPAATAAVDRVRFAVAGCQHYEEGHYTAWRRIAEEPLDFVFHYGDYIYEGASQPGLRKMNGQPFTNLRNHVGPQTYTLDDYRRRYAQYKSDTDLQAAHASAPWFVTFDDHEVDNNWAGAEDQDDTPSEVFLLRRVQAFQAYYENMPLRRSAFPRDGHMQMQMPKGRVAYDPSSLQDDTPRETPSGFRSHASADDGRKGRTRAESFADHYSQARMFFRSLEKPEQAHLASALVFELSKVETLKVRVRTVSHLRNIDDALAQRVADGLALPALPDPAPTATPARDMPPAPEVRVIGRNKPTLQGRCIGILFDEGSDARIIANLSKAARKAGADVKLVAPKVGGATLSDGALQAADGQLAGTPSAVFDAVAVVLSLEAAKALSKESAAVEFVSQAWAHLKAIASDAGGQALLKAARVGNDAGIVEAEDTKAFMAVAATRQWAREPKLRLLA